MHQLLDEKCPFCLEKNSSIFAAEAAREQQVESALVYEFRVVFSFLSLKQHAKCKTACCRRRKTARQNCLREVLAKVGSGELQHSANGRLYLRRNYMYVSISSRPLATCWCCCRLVGRQQVDANMRRMNRASDRARERNLRLPAI